jgi:hypothetical protein
MGNMVNEDIKKVIKKRVNKGGKEEVKAGMPAPLSVASLNFLGDQKNAMEFMIDTDKFKRDYTIIENRFKSLKVDQVLSVMEHIKSQPHPPVKESTYKVTPECNATCTDKAKREREALTTEQMTALQSMREKTVWDVLADQDKPKAFADPFLALDNKKEVNNDGRRLNLIQQGLEVYQNIQGGDTPAPSWWEHFGQMKGQLADGQLVTDWSTYEEHPQLFFWDIACNMAAVPAKLSGGRLEYDGDELKGKLAYVELHRDSPFNPANVNANVATLLAKALDFDGTLPCGPAMPKTAKEEEDAKKLPDDLANRGLVIGVQEFPEGQKLEALNLCLNDQERTRLKTYFSGDKEDSVGFIVSTKISSLKTSYVPHPMLAKGFDGTDPTNFLKKISEALKDSVALRDTAAVGDIVLEKANGPNGQPRIKSGIPRHEVVQFLKNKEPVPGPQAIASDSWDALKVKSDVTGATKAEKTMTKAEVKEAFGDGEHWTINGDLYSQSDWFSQSAPGTPEEISKGDKDSKGRAFKGFKIPSADPKDPKKKLTVAEVEKVQGAWIEGLKASLDTTSKKTAYLDVGDSLRFLNVHAKVFKEAQGMDVLAAYIKVVARLDDKDARRTVFVTTDSNADNAKLATAFQEGLEKHGFTVITQANAQNTTCKQRTHMHGQIYDKKKCGADPVMGHKDFIAVLPGTDSSNWKMLAKDKDHPVNPVVFPVVSDTNTLPSEQWPSDHCLTKAYFDGTLEAPAPKA